VAQKTARCRCLGAKTGPEMRYFVARFRCEMKASKSLEEGLKESSF